MIPIDSKENQMYAYMPFPNCLKYRLYFTHILDRRYGRQYNYIVPFTHPLCACAKHGEDRNTTLLHLPLQNRVEKNQEWCVVISMTYWIQNDKREGQLQ